jgi:hypothetical protein
VPAAELKNKAISGTYWKPTLASSTLMMFFLKLCSPDFCLQAETLTKFLFFYGLVMSMNLQ